MANAFIKIALGDEDKLGAIASSPAGPALINLLCDLFNDLQDAPVTTLLKKLSDAEGLAAIADFAMSLLNGYDSTFKSYDLFFTDGIMYDGQGNTTFYTYVNEQGNVDYNGPKAMDQYLPVIAAALDFLDDISDAINANGGDLLKTLLVDKLPQLGNILRAAISYNDGSGEKVGMIAYLLDDYKTYLQALNAVLSDDVLISIAEAAITEAQGKITDANAEIAIWQEYLEQANAAADAQKLAKAKELGLLPDTETTYDEEAVNAAIEAKISQLNGEIAQLQQDIQAAQADLPALEQAANDAEAALNALNTFADGVYDGDFYDILTQIFDEEDTSYIDDLRDACEDDFNDNVGEGAFDDLAALIIDHLSEYAGDVDAFIEDYVLGSYGIGIYDMQATLEQDYNDADQAYQDAQNDITDLQNQADDKGNQLTALEDGTVLQQIQAAGANATIHISDTRINVEGDLSVEDIQGAITTIQTEEIGGYEGTIAAEQAKIADYTTDKDAQRAAADAYDLEGLNLEQTALKKLVDDLMVFLGGDANTKSLYTYFNEGQPIEMLVAPDRVNALKNIIDDVISLFGDKIDSGADHTTQLWAIEEKLFGTNGILSTLYNDFLDDPVLSIATRVKPIAEIVDIVYDMGFFREMIDQYKPLIDAVAGIFGDDSEGFIAQWKQAYADGSANHHYVNAVLSLLPKIVAIYDQVKDMDAVKDLIGPYSDIIELVLGLLSKDFYDDVINDGIVETLLEDSKLEELQDAILKVLDLIELENKDQIKALVNTLFDQILDGLYQDILTDPVLALASRINKIADLAGPVTQMFNFDISPYQSIIDDVKALFGDNFTKDWKKSKLIALINAIAPLTDLLGDVIDVIPADTIKGWLDNLPAEIKDKLPDNIVDIVIPMAKNLLAGIKSLSTNLVNDYHKSPVTAIAKRVPTIVDMLTGLVENDDVVNLVFELIRDVQIGEGEDAIKLGDFENVARRVIANFKDSIGPILKEVINEKTINTYKKDKLKGALILVGGALELVKNIAGDEELINDILDLDVVKSIPLGDTMTVEDISGAIKAVAAMLPDLLENIDAQYLLNGLLNKPVETIVDLAGVLADAIDALLASDDDFISQYTSALENTLELIRDLLRDITIEGDKIVITFIDTKKPIESVLSSENIRRIQAALREVADFIESLGMEGTEDIVDALDILANALKNIDGLVERMPKQSLLKTVEQLGNFIRDAKPALELLGDIEIGDAKLSDFLDILDAALVILDNIGTDADKSLVGAVLSRVGDIGNLIKTIFENETICAIEIGDYTIGDFKDAADILVKILDENFYEDYTANPIRAIFDRIDYVKALYEWVKDFGLLDGVELKKFGFDILKLIDIALPIVDKQLYYDFEQSLFKAITSSDRIGRIEKALKDIIHYADIFSYSVNEGLCSVISGVCGVLDGLYDSLLLPTTPENGGNQIHSTSRVIVKKLPAIQNLLRSLKPLLGKGKLLNLTDVVSDTVKMEKEDLLKAIVGVDLIKPYYYGISDILDVVGENAAKYDWNTFAGIITDADKERIRISL